MSVGIRGRMLWLETNYCGQAIRGKVTNESHQHRLPIALRRIPRLFLDFGDVKTKPLRKNKRIPFTENDFDKEKPHDLIWDLYFEKMQQDRNARFVLVPRGVFDWHQPIYPEAVGCLGWQYVGELESFTFRWDLYLLLADFFGASQMPHCTIEAFLPSLVRARNDRPVRQTQEITKVPPRSTKRETSTPREIVCTDNRRLPQRTSKSKVGPPKMQKRLVLADASNEIYSQ